MTNIGIFCGSSMGTNTAYANAALQLARLLLKNKQTLIYGGANVGLMKILADTILEGGGRAIGIMPRGLVEKEVAYDGLSQLHIVDSMQERKIMMAEISDAFVTLPGGFGTLDELAEMITYNQLRIHDKPLGILNIQGYFDNLLRFLDHGVSQQFIRQEHRNNLIVDENPGNLLNKLNDYQPVTMDKWIHDIKKESRHLH